MLLQESAGTTDIAAKRATEAPEVAAGGAGSTPVIEGAHGWWAGTGALSAHGLGPLLVAGPIVARLAEIGFGGTLGELAGALLGLRIPEYEARRYQGSIENGGILLSMHCDSPICVEKAKLLLNSTGAEDISSTSESAADWHNSNRLIQRKWSCRRKNNLQRQSTLAARPTSERDRRPKAFERRDAVSRSWPLSSAL